MSHSTFMIIQQLSPPTSRPYRLLETCETSDGPRTRVCDGTWRESAEAFEEVGKRSGAQRPRDLGKALDAALQDELEHPPASIMRDEETGND